MEGIRAWASSVIAAAILAGVVEFALPKTHLEKSVKVLLSLFMLISFLSPAVGLLTAPQRTKSGLDELLEEYEAQEALEQTVRETLEQEIVSSIKAYAAQQGAALEKATATVHVDGNNNIAVERIEITVTGTAESKKAIDEYCWRSFSVHPIMREGKEPQSP